MSEPEKKMMIHYSERITSLKYPDNTEISSFAFHPTAETLAMAKTNDPFVGLYHLYHLKEPVKADATANVGGNDNKEFYYEEYKDDNYGHCHSIAFHPTSPLMLTGYEKRAAKLWRISDDGKTFTHLLKPIDDFTDEYTIKIVAFHPTLPFFIISAIVKPLGETGETYYETYVFKYEYSSPEVKILHQIHIPHGSSRCVLSVAFHPTEPFVFLGQDKNATLWKLPTNEDSAAVEYVKDINLDMDVQSCAFHNSVIIACSSGGITFLDGSLDDKTGVPKCSELEIRLDTTAYNPTNIKSAAFHRELPIILIGHSGAGADVTFVKFTQESGSIRINKAITLDTLQNEPQSSGGNAQFEYDYVRVAFHPSFPSCATCFANSLSIWNIKYLLDQLMATGPLIDDATGMDRRGRDMGELPIDTRGAIKVGTNGGRRKTMTRKRSRSRRRRRSKKKASYCKKQRRTRRRM